MVKKFCLSSLLGIGILLTAASPGYSQDFWRGKIISGSGNDASIYSVVDGGIFRFNSESKTWERRGSAPAPVFEYATYQVDDKGYIWSDLAGGAIVYSKDEGNVWNAFGKVEDPIFAFKVIGGYVYSNSLGAGGNKTYRKKADGTADWQLIYSGATPLDFTATANGDIYLTFYQFKVLKSSDNGATWTNTGGPDYRFPSTPWIMSSIGNRIFVGTYWHGIYYSDDGGAVWKSSTGLPVEQPGASPFGTRGVSTILIRNETEVFTLVKDQAGTLGWYKSNDGGQSFQKMNFPYSKWVINWLYQGGLSGNDLIVAADYWGFLHTNNNGTTWTEVNNGVNNIKPHHVARMMKNSNNELFALMTSGHLSSGPGASWGLLKSGDNGVSWVPIDDKLEDRWMTLEDLLVAKNGDLYVTTYEPGTYRKSRDNGVTWQKYKVVSRNDSSKFISTVMMMKEIGLDTIVAGSYFNNLWRTFDGGTTWTEQEIVPRGGVKSFDTKGKVIYAISRDQISYNGLFKSTDVGNTWSKINAIGNYSFDKIKIFGTSLFATAGALVLRSDDDGVNWVNISPVLQQSAYIMCLDIVTVAPTSGRTQADETKLLVGTSDGLFTTSVSATQWKKVEDGVVYSIASLGNNVYVGTETGTTVETVAEAIKQSQSITFPVLPAKTIGDAKFDIVGTASSSLPVTFTSSNPSVATVSGTSVTIVGFGTTVIKASQSGNATYSAATASRVLVVSKKTQTITFNQIGVKDVNDVPFSVAATSSAGLPVSVSSDNLLVATVDGTKITIKGVGTAKIKASQNGDNTFGAALTIERTLTVVTKANQTLTFAAIPDKTVGDPIFGLTASATSNLPVTFSAVSDNVAITTNQATIVTAGRAVVKASQPGNDSYNPAPAVEQSFCIKPSKPTISVGSDVTESPTLTSSAPAGNQWYKDGAAISGATGKTLVATTVGVYKVQAKVDDCIGEFSANVALVVTGNHSPENAVITVYPNPAEDYVEVGGVGEGISGAQLFDMTGRSSSLMLEKTGEVFRGNVQHLTPGLYVLRVQEGNSVRQVKLIKR